MFKRSESLQGGVRCTWPRPIFGLEYLKRSTAHPIDVSAAFGLLGLGILLSRKSRYMAINKHSDLKPEENHIKGSSAATAATCTPVFSPSDTVSSRRQPPYKNNSSVCRSAPRKVSCSAVTGGSLIISCNYYELVTQKQK